MVDKNHFTGFHPSITAVEFPNKAAYVMANTGETVTYKQLDEGSNQAARLLRSLGVEAGDVIALIAKNHVDFLEVCWGAQRSGLYFTPVSWYLTSIELAYILKDSAAKVIFVAAEFVKTVEKAIAEGDIDIIVVTLGESYQALRGQHSTDALDNVTAGSDMMYTSGTIGQPKAVKVPLSSHSIDTVDLVQMMYRNSGFDHNAIAFAPGPLYHATPLRTAMYTLTFGGTVVILDKFDPQQALAIIEKYQVSHSSWVPTHFVRLLKLSEQVRKQYDISSMRGVFHTAAPCSIEVKRAVIDWFGPIVTEYYGGTEANGGSVITSDEWLSHPGSVGRPSMGSVHVMDEDNWNELPVGAIGTLYFDGGREFSYHNDPDKSASVTSPQGWITMGDIGHVDDDGYIYLTDRKANMIISGGVNIYPQEAENRLQLHPMVADVAVFGIPNIEFGEEVKAVVQLEVDGGYVHLSQSQTEIELILLAFCKEGLSPIKCPRSIDIAEQLPRHENGKLYKRLIKDQYLKVQM